MQNIRYDRIFCAYIDKNGLIHRREAVAELIQRYPPHFSGASADANRASAESIFVKNRLLISSKSIRCKIYDFIAYFARHPFPAHLFPGIEGRPAPTRFAPRPARIFSLLNPPCALNFDAFRRMLKDADEFVR